MIKKISFIKQLDSQDCGFACLKMVGKYYNKNFIIDDDFISNSNIQKQGISITELENFAGEFSF